MAYKCEIVADSCNTFGNRITTFLITFPRFILAEFNTHRVFSRNSASSRAIPLKKMIQSVSENPFIPLKWIKEHSGMQGYEYFSDQEVADLELVENHLLYRDIAIEAALKANKKGVTKQLCNRYLEFFSWHTVLVTSTEWENFFALRANDQAEIHIQKIAYMMLDAYNNSAPVQLNEGQWHIPFLEKISKIDVTPFLMQNHETHEEKTELFLKIATAMCARTSYTIIGQEDKPIDVAADLKLYERLSTSGHWSPFEHCAKPMNNEEYRGCYHSTLVTDEIETISRNISHGVASGLYTQWGWSGNFRGFIQYRKLFYGENGKDSRIKPKQTSQL